MPAPRTLVLTPDQRTELERAQRTDSRPYVRERCSALLQIADGASVRQVAGSGLLRPRRPQTVASWLTAYQRDNLAGLKQASRGARGYPP
jgi:hypothetical protein